jgi:hypothetical protein
MTTSQQGFLPLPGKNGYLLGEGQNPHQTSHSFHGRGAADQYESRLLSKYLNPPSLPNTANYQKIKLMARTGDGRGPFVAPAKPVAPSPVYGSMKRRKK